MTGQSFSSASSPRHSVGYGRSARAFCAVRLVLVVFIAFIPILSQYVAHADSSTPDYLAQVNFQRQVGVAPPTGYTRDWGQSYDPIRGYGWIQASTTTPMDMTSWARIRDTTDPLLDSFVHMQPNASTQARWRYAAPNGRYEVTVGVGDPGYTDSIDRLTIDGTVAVNNFVPTTAQHNQVDTVDITVTDGFITLDPAGGTNTKVDYVQIVVLSPRFVSSSPTPGQAGVSTSSSIILNPNTNVDPSTVDSTTFVVLDASNNTVPGSYNSDAAGGVETFTPTTQFAPNTTYSFHTTSGLTDLNGISFLAYSGTFTTGAGGVKVAPISFSRSVFATYPAVTSMTFGPDGKLYWSTATGNIYRAAVNPDGSRNGNVEDLGGWPDTSLVTGITFDPDSTASDLRLWVSRGYLGFDNVPNFTGYLSELTGPNLQTERDVVSGLPRSVHDHMNNGIKFGPDGKLYMAMGALQGYGAADNYWGDRPETGLSAAILQMDVDNNPAFQSTVDVTTAPDGTYDPSVANAPVKAYAVGVRNAYDLLWDTNGKLYAPVNESTGGNTPAGPNNKPPALAALPAYDDYFASIVPGGYYGHPNPSEGHYVLDGGNPTSGTDYFEIPGYPVGTKPDPAWVPPLLDFGLHRSPDGIAEYTSNVFGPAYQGMILITEYSAGDDLLALFPDSNGNIAGEAQLATGFNNPIQVITNPTNGDLYVAEYGSQPDGTGGQIDLLTPNVQQTDGSLKIDTAEETVGVGNRLVLENVLDVAPLSRAITVANTGTTNLAITGFSFGGTDSANFALAAGQQSSFVLAPGASQQVSFVLNVADPWTKWEYDGTLTVLSNDSAGSQTIPLVGISMPGFEGNDEPNVRLLMKAFGLGTKITEATTSHSLGNSPLPNGDEIITPYLTRVDTTKPVTVTALGRWETRSSGATGSTGWFPKPAQNTTTISRKLLFNFAGGDVSTYGGENQKLFPTPTGVNTFTPTSTAFGLYSDYTWASDDRLNGCPADPHDIRFFPVKDQNGNAIPGELIAGVDISCSGKNHDFQDEFLLLQNVQPEVAASATVLPFTNSFSSAVTGTLVDGTGQGTGFDDVLPNTAGTQYAATKLALNTAGSSFAITSSPGTFVGTANTQVDAVRKTLDISAKTSASISTTLLSPSSLSATGDAAGLYYGPDQDNLVTVQLENDSGALTLAAYVEQNGVRTAIGTPVALSSIVADPTQVTSIKLTLAANVAAGTIGASYQVTTTTTTGAATTIGTSPAVTNRQYWFSRSAGTGLYVTQSGGTAFTGTYDTFSITTSP